MLSHAEMCRIVGHFMLFEIHVRMYVVFCKFFCEFFSRFTNRASAGSACVN